MDWGAAVTLAVGVLGLVVGLFVQWPSSRSGRARVKQELEIAALLPPDSPARLKLIDGAERRLNDLLDPRRRVLPSRMFLAVGAIVAGAALLAIGAALGDDWVWLARGGALMAGYATGDLFFAWRERRKPPAPEGHDGSPSA